MKNISFYSRAWEIESTDTIPLDIFLDNIRTGQYQDVYFEVSRIEDKKQRDAVKKKKAASVTISGLFTKREDDKIKEHSGFLGIDIDPDGLPEKLTLDETKSLLAPDKYIYSIFRSISGRGLCCLFRVNPNKHREAFVGICEYLHKHYRVVCDPTSINPSRARFVSYDPEIFIADQLPAKFCEYSKLKEPKKYDPIVFSSDDFGEILNQIVTNQLVIDQGNYLIWIKIAFGLISKFGESGRQHFHTVSQYSTLYDQQDCDNQFSVCLRSHEERPKETPANISTFYYFAKQAGCKIYSDRTKTIAFAAKQGNKSGLSNRDIVKNLDHFENISGDDVLQIVEQVIRDGVFIEDETVIDQLEMYLRQNYQLRRNEITRYIENFDRQVEKKDLNTIYIKLKKLFPKISYDIVDRLIDSDFVPMYNPFMEYFREQGVLGAATQNAATGPETAQISTILPSPANATTGAIIAALGSIPATPDPRTPEFAILYPTIVAFWSTIKTPDADYLLYFGTKWLIGIISSIHGQHSPIYLALGGEEHGTGKTEFYRRLTPKKLYKYYGESKLDEGKDDRILMCQKIILMDDESSGKTRKENGKIKDLTSKQVFSLREPYGHGNVDLMRLASLCSTTNIPEEILNDPTDNRRFVTVDVQDIDHTAYNRIDKNELWCEMYRLYKTGWDWEIRRSDKPFLNKYRDKFQTNTSEADLIMKYFVTEGTEEMTATDIKDYIERHTMQKLSLHKLGIELKRLGFDQKHVKIGNGTKRVYITGHTMILGQQSPKSPRSIDTPITGWKPPVSGDNDDVPF